MPNLPRIAALVRTGSGSACAIATCAYAACFTSTAPYPLQYLSGPTPEVQFQPTVCIWRGTGGDMEGLGRAGQSENGPAATTEL